MARYEERIKRMLPKTYLRKPLAREIYEALIHFKNLEPLMDTYVYNDGNSKVLMSLTGTIPIVFKDKTYNIPVCLWVEDSYPQTAPICYVRPTRDMMIVKGKYVSSNGEVLLPYQQEWKQGECDLLSLLQVMVATFGDSPPICMLPPEQQRASCRLQFHSRAEVLSKADGSLYLSLPQEDAQHENETNC